MCVLVDRKCVQLSFLLSCGFAGRVVEEGALVPPLLLTPPPSRTVLPALGSVVGKCVCVSVRVCVHVCVCVSMSRGVRGGVMKGEKKLSVAPAIEVPLLCLVRPLCARTYTH